MTDQRHPDPQRLDPASAEALSANQARTVRPAAISPQPAPAPAPAGRRSGTSKLVIGGALIAAVVALWQFGPRFGWGPGGRDGGNEQGGGADSRRLVDERAQAAAGKVPAGTPQRPMRVKIDGTRYVVDGRDVDLATLTRLAAVVPSGAGPAVEVERTGASRATAEQELKAALEGAGQSATWMPPLE